MSITVVRSLGLFFGAYGFLGCFTGQAGQPLAKIPPVQVQALLSTTEPSGGTATLYIVPQDLTQCPKVADSTRADINGIALILSDSGGWRDRKGGFKYCAPPQFDGTGIPLTGDAMVRLHDSTATFELDAPGALLPMSLALVQPADGVLRPGAAAEIQITPTVGAITHASIGFLPTSASATSFSVEFPSSASNLSVSNSVLSFTVPSTTAPAVGSLKLSVSIAVTPSRCKGPAVCAAQTGGSGSIATSVTAL